MSINLYNPSTGLTRLDTANKIPYTNEKTLKQALANEIYERINAIGSEATTRANADILLGERIDNIVAPSGEAPSAAEVADARVGADGKTYSSLGASIRTQIDDAYDEIATKCTLFKNLFNYNDPDVIIGGYYDASGNYISNTSLMSSGFIPVVPGKKYRASAWTTATMNTIVTFWNSSKNFISSIVNLTNGCVEIPTGTSYVRVIFNIYNNSDGDYVHQSFCEGTKLPPKYIPYNKVVLESFEDGGKGLDELKPYAEARGILKTDGTIDTSFSTIKIFKFKNFETDKVYIYGTGTFYTGYNFAYIWGVKNGQMDYYIAPYHNPEEFINYEIDVTDIDELWLSTYDGGPLCYMKTYVDLTARKNIEIMSNKLFNQWKGKVWYAYGTSITSVHQNTGKYPIYLAQMLEMELVEKGIGGGGIGNLGAYSTGQVYNAIRNITDGKLNADLITLETGANDVNENTPLGTIYDTGTSTLAGCLNDCIAYLQENTDAQIAITPSPVYVGGTAAEVQAYLNWALMIEQICAINRVHFLKPDNTMGRAKLSSSKGSNYIVDNVHQTELGGYVMAENLWYQLRNIPVFRTSVPI